MKAKERYNVKNPILSFRTEPIVVEKIKIVADKRDKAVQKILHDIVKDYLIEKEYLKVEYK